MEGIEHRTVRVNGIKMHIAEKGQGPLVLFLHGFPDLWYTWRHQIRALAASGFHAVAPDLRGYGDTDAPSAIPSYTCHHVVGDLIELIDSLGEEKVYLVGHDWGAVVGWYVCLFRPERVKAFVCLSVQYRPRDARMRPVESLSADFGDDYYICRFQKPGEVEGDIAKLGAAAAIRQIITNRTPGPPRLLPKGNAFGITPDHPPALPSWFTEQDLAYYATKFDHKGFSGGLNYYRAIDLNWELTAAWTRAQVKVPVKFIVGDLDVTYTTPGVKEYIHNGGFKKAVPFLEEVVVMEGVAHFIHQERAEEVNTHIVDFIKKH